MPHVPVIPPDGSPPSPRARALSQRIAQVIREFQREHPDTRPADIQRAMRLAWGEAGVRTSQQVVLLVLLALVVLGLALGLFVVGQ